VPLFATRRIGRTERADAVYSPSPLARAIARRDPEGAWRTVDASRYRAPSPLEAEASSADPDGTAIYRDSWFFHTPSLWRRGLVFNSDLDEGDLSRVESLRRVSSYAAADASGAPLFESVSLRFATRWRDQQPLPGFSRFGGAGPREWDENAAAARDVRLLTRWRETDGALAALRELPALASGEAVVESGRAGTGESGGGEIRALEKTPERLALSVASRGAGWLFVLRGYWAHRRVLVDGRDAPTVPAQLAFTAVRVPAGEHRVEWLEEVPGYPASLLGPAAFAAAAVAALARRRARTPNPAEAA
jgi:hypothetical protein